MTLQVPSYEVIPRALAVKGPIRFGQGGDTSFIQGAEFPKSGPSGDGAGHAGPGSTYFDRTRQTLWVNEGTRLSPYWSPVSFDQPGMVSIHTSDFLTSDGKAEADTGTSVILGPHGWTVLGDGVHETDSGAVVQGAAEGNKGAIRLSSSAMAAGDLAALCTPIVAGAGIYQPDQHGMGVIDVDLTNVAAITTRIVYVGFSGIAAAGQTDVITGATTVTTLVENDLAGLYMASTLTDADRIIAAWNAANGAATQDFSVITALNTGINMAAAATAQRFRGEIDGDGALRLFIDKAQVFSVPAGTMELDQELNALVYVSPTTTTQAEIDVLRASFVMGRAA